MTKFANALAGASGFVGLLVLTIGVAGLAGVFWACVVLGLVLLLSAAVR